jgi:hypothetical protein
MKQELTNEQLQKFESRLSRYGLKIDAIQQETLYLTENSYVYLDGVVVEKSLYKPVFLQCKNPASLKNYVGIPQEYFTVTPDLFVPDMPSISVQKITSYSKISGNISDLSFKTPRKDIDEEFAFKNGKELKKAFNAYLHGDSKLTTQYLTYFESMFEKAKLNIPVWLYKTVEIESGATLEFGTGYNVLSAARIIIHPNANIKFNGKLTINALSIEQLN